MNDHHIGIKLIQSVIGWSVVVSALTLLCVGCQSADEKLQQKREQAVQSVGEAQQKATEVEREQAVKVANSAPQKKDERKIEATEKIAEAQGDVQEAKIKATKKVVSAEQNAGAGGSYTKDDSKPGQ